MIALDCQHLLMIEPKRPASITPTRDALSEKMARLLATATIGSQWRGWHTCVCGASSGSDELVLSDGTITNSLALHYLERHRNEVPQAELNKLAGMQCPSPNAKVRVSE
jgi:hypothetical protein